MENSARKVVEKMFNAFGKGDVNQFIETVSDDTVWIYHGTQYIPKRIFEKKTGAKLFITSILNKTEMISFEPQKFIVEGNTVVVLGQEHQRIKKSGKELRQKWVQVYSVENDLIIRMEEFAASEALN